jgi:glycosyltransferase involved in cell wall biosynthesis
MKMEAHYCSDNNSKPVLQPFFSVIITTYNRAHILNRALDSLIAQTEHDWEAIIVDDESTDNTYFKILPYLSSNPQIRYLRKVHSGEPLSKNAGIKSSAGKFITFLDSDDEYYPVHLQARKAILIQNPAIRFLHGGARIIGNQYVPDRFDWKKRVNLSECVIGGTFIIEKSVLFQLNGFRQIMLGTDADLYDRIVDAGIPVNETKIPTYIYHHENEDSITNMLLKNNSEAHGIYSDINSK